MIYLNSRFIDLSLFTNGWEAIRFLLIPSDIRYYTLDKQVPSKETCSPFPGRESLDPITLHSLFVCYSFILSLGPRHLNTRGTGSCKSVGVWGPPFSFWTIPTYPQGFDQSYNRQLNHSFWNGSQLGGIISDGHYSLYSLK